MRARKRRPAVKAKSDSMSDVKCKDEVSFWRDDNCNCQP